MGKRLTRKEIVQADRIQTSLTSIYGWVTRNRGLLLTVLGVFLVTLVVSYVWQQYQEGQDQQLQARFGEALEQYHEAIAVSPTNPPVSDEEAPSAEADEEENLAPDLKLERQQKLEEVLPLFSAIVEDHSHAPLGILSRYYRALVRQELGQDQEAEQDLSAIVAQASKAEIRNLARSLLAQLAQADDVERATGLLEAIVNESPDPFPRDGVLLQIARNYELAGKQGEALEYYKRLTSEYPSSQHIQAAQSRISQLEPESAPESGEVPASAVESSEP